MTLTVNLSTKYIVLMLSYCDWSLFGVRRHLLSVNTFSPLDFYQTLQRRYKGLPLPKLYKRLRLVAYVVRNRLQKCKLKDSCLKS